MRLIFYVTLAIMSFGVYKYAYYLGYNTGSNDERAHVIQVIAPLCAALNDDSVDRTVACIQDALK